MRQPRFSLNEHVVINDNTEVNDILRGLRCQVKDYNRDKDEYHLCIVQGKHAGEYLWTPTKYIWSWSQYRLAQTIDKSGFEEYTAQMLYANRIRDAIFKRIYGITPEHADIDEFKHGKRVRVHRRAVSKKPWERWSSEMNNVQGECGKVIETNRLYNSAINEYEDVVHVEFISKELFSDFIYAFWFLPEHLELER